MTYLCPTSEFGEAFIPATPVASTSYHPQSFIQPPSKSSNLQFIEGGTFSTRHSLSPHIRTSPSPTSTRTKEDLDYLQGFKFTVNLNGPFPQIDGLFPHLSQYIKEKNQKLTAYFVLSPEYEQDPKEELVGNSYCSEAEIDLSDFVEIHTTSPRHISRVQNNKASKNKGKILCCYNSWVSISSSIFL